VSPILGIWASSSAASRADTGAMFPLQVITVGPAGASSVSFTNIPGTYSHLQIRGIAKNGTSSGNETTLLVQFNSDSTYTNYFGRHLLYGDGSTAAAAANNTSSWVGATAGAIAQQSTANTYSAFVTDILDYSNGNKNKTVRTLTGADYNGSGTIVLASGLWINTAAVTSITLVPFSNTFGQYSQFALYAVKGA